MDSLTIYYYMGWASAGNIQSEIVAQMLVEKRGPAKAAELFPININPDDETGAAADITNSFFRKAALGLRFDKNLLSYSNDDLLKIGSNNWVTSPNLLSGAMPVVANDPHQAASILPGPLYPCGLITPKLHAVGVTVPGFGGMVIGRTAHIALGATNAYGDTQDLYVETIDPDNSDNYLEGSISIPFEVIEETLKFKDKTVSSGFKEEKIKIRLTHRGPVISDVLPGLETNKVITVRWSGFEVQSPSIGLEKLVGCRTVEETRQALGASIRSP